MSDDKTPPTGRSRRRRNVIGSSPNRDEYVRMLKAGWSSLALEKYAAFRYGEDIPANTFRYYRKRLKEDDPNAIVKYQEVKTDQMVDVIGERAQLLELQKRRIGLDWEHEKNMSKLFSSMGREIDLYNRLLDSHKADLQDLGLLPKTAEQIQMTMTGAADAPAAPKHKTLADAIGADLNEDGVLDIAQTLANVIQLPGTTNEATG